MRKYAPIVVVIVAFSAYVARDVLFHPLVGGNRVAPKARDRGSFVATSRDGAGGPDGARIALPRPSDLPNAIESDKVVHGTISRGKPFFVEMKQAGISPLDIENIVQAARAVFNFKKIHPGQKYSIYSDRTGAIDSLKFVVDHEKTLNVARVGDSYRARVDMVPFRYERYVTTARVDQSLFVSLQDIDADPELAIRLANIFQWDIDFFKDIHKGDTFSILYERKVYENGRTILGDVLGARVRTQGHDHFAFRYQSESGLANYFDQEGRSLQKSLLRTPLEYSRVSSNFSYRRFHPVNRHYAPHLGVDYAAPYGTPVRATGDGTIAEAGWGDGTGKFVRIRHNSRYETYYLHLSRFGQGIRAGAHVSQGQVIGYVGATGLATGPHLDYRIKAGGTFVNPRTIELPSKDPVPPSEMASFENARNTCLAGLFEVQAENTTVCLGKREPVKLSRVERMF